MAAIYNLPTHRWWWRATRHASTIQRPAGGKERSMTKPGQSLDLTHSNADESDSGATWVDGEVVMDGNLVTSRQPCTISAFNHEMLQLFTRRPQTAAR
jgi:putative intracellular protease/amidase